jgi:regulator of cell morphogenesis and NO signaling
MYLYGLIKIQIIMEINLKTKVGEIVRHNFSTARLFEDYHIDFCCGGDISLEDAAGQEGIGPAELISDIIKMMHKESPDSNYIENLSLTDLADHIIATHHSYINKTIPFIQLKIDKLCAVHGMNHAELFELKDLFNTAAGNLTMHMKKEELILFPYIRNIENFKQHGGSKPGNIGIAASAITQMKMEHQAEGDRFSRISEITNYYQVPKDGCNTYEVSYKTLEEFETDLHRHIHLENNILFPKALIMEKLLI